MRKPLRVISFLLLIAALAAAWSFRAPLEESYKALFSQLRPVLAPKPRPDPATYATLAADLERWRKDLSTRHLGLVHSAALTPASGKCSREWVGRTWRDRFSSRQNTVKAALALAAF